MSETIFSITYNKEAEEYIIKTKDEHGVFMNTYVWDLTEEEKAFIRGCRTYYQTPYKIVWAC